MKRNGFTLIELLAVIVILAIIALIAVPIILNIIDDADEKSAERSIELYASAVKNSIAAYRLNNTVAPENFSDLTIDYEGDVDCKTQILYPDKTIYLAGCTVNGGEKEYSYGTLKATPVCTVAKQDSTKYSVGDVVTCELSESTDKFYIIEEQPLTATTVQMLTEKNIHTTEFRQSDNAGTIAFSSTVYWVDEHGDILPQYNKIGDYMYDVYNENNDKVKPIVDEYIKYINQKLATTTGSLLTNVQAENLGCSRSTGYCPNAPSWVYPTSYWCGSATAGYGFVTVIGIYTGGNMVGNSFYDTGSVSGVYDSSGVRPVITIPTSAIK